MDLKTFFDILKLNKEDREKLFNSAFPLRAVADEEPKLSSEDLEKKVEDRARSLAEIYFSLKKGPDRLEYLTALDMGYRLEYGQEFDLADRINDPADYFAMLANLCEKIKDKIVCELGILALREDKPSHLKITEYKRAGIEYLASLK
jgi:hypothetical protein